MITTTETNRSPWFNMVKMNSNGIINLLLSGNEHIKRRQDSPIIYDMTTVAYVTSPEFILKNKNKIQSSTGTSRMKHP